MQKRNDSGKRFDKKGGKTPPSFSSSKKSYGNDDNKSSRKPSGNSSRGPKEDGFKPNSRAKSYGDSSFSPRSSKPSDRNTSDRFSDDKKPYNRGKSTGEDKFSSSSRKPSARGTSDRFDADKKPYSRSKNVGEDKFSSSSRKPSARGTSDGYDADKKPYSRSKNVGEDKFSSSSRKPSARGTSDRFDADKKPYNRGKSVGEDKFSSSSRKPSARGAADKFDADKKPYNRGKSAGDDKFSSSSRKPSTRTSADKFDTDKKPYNRGKSAGEDKFSSSSRKPSTRVTTDKKDSYGKSTSSRRTKDEFSDEPKRFAAKPENINSKESFRKKGISEDAKPLKGKSTKEKTKFEFRSVRKAKFADEKNTKVNKKTAEEDLNFGEIRLNRFIANAGICSRREADTLITAGLVTINGVAVTEMGYKVKAGDDIRYNGERLSVEEKIYILMNKPKDAITTAVDPEGRKTIFDLIEGRLAQRVFAVGRLDRNTTGVLLLTNDGDLAQRLMHPKYEVEKVYIATLNKDLTKNDLWQLAGGVELEDGMIKPDAVAYAEESKKDVIGVEIHSGRNRIVHRMFEHMGYLVDKLDRVAYAGLTKSKLKRGEWRELTEKELKTLRRNVKIG
ncbi:MAG: pseudouridine synthase [Bacteroidota bacterium]